MSYTRSIVCEHGELSLCRNLVLLRTLHGNKKSSYFSEGINLNSLVFRYVNLRHISIRAPMMSSAFLSSISRLWNLNTLVVSYLFLSEPIVFADFWKMPQFKNIEFPDDCARLLNPPNCDADAVVIMENLQTLKGVRNFKCSEDVVKRIPNIKRLKLEYNRSDIEDEEDDDDEEEEEDVYFVGNLKNLCGLEFLTVGFLAVGPISPMRKITFPHSLKKLSLEMDLKYEWGDMLEKIGSLPLLEKLKLSDGSFGKGKWEIAEEQFPCLKYLCVCRCEDLENWTASENDSSILPRLEHLELDNLVELKEIPSEIGNIDTLKIIKLIGCREGLVMSVKEMFDEQVELQGGEDQLSFHVDVKLNGENQRLQSLAGPNFYVNLSWFCF